MQLIWNILLVSAVANVFVLSGVTRPIKALIHNIFKKTYTRIKPFDCVFCMAFWIGFISFGFTWNGFELACMCSMVAESCNRLFKLIPIAI